MFLVDDLTFLLFCQYEFHMTVWEIGVLFACTAVCLLAYGLTISGFIIDKLGVKYSLVTGLSLYAVAKFILIFAESRLCLQIVMCTLAPLGISIVFPCLILGVKKLTNEVNRPFGFQLFFAATITGAIFGGPIVDWVRHDYKYTTWHYTHHNDELDRDEDRV